jgi:hypothetical protein
MSILNKSAKTITDNNIKDKNYKILGYHGVGLWRILSAWLKKKGSIPSVYAVLYKTINKPSL